LCYFKLVWCFVPKFKSGIQYWVETLHYEKDLKYTVCYERFDTLDESIKMLD